MFKRLAGPASRVCRSPGEGSSLGDAGGLAAPAMLEGVRAQGSCGDGNKKSSTPRRVWYYLGILVHAVYISTPCAGPRAHGFYTARDTPSRSRDPSVGLGQSKVVAWTSLLFLEKGGANWVGTDRALS